METIIRRYFVDDANGIKETGFEIGEEIPVIQDSVAVLISEENHLWILELKNGKFYTVRSNDDFEGTLDECIDFLNNEAPEQETFK